MIHATPGALTTALLEGAPAGLTITARLVDGDETLPTIVTVAPELDAQGDALNAYAAAFAAPADLPVTLEWLEGATVVGDETVTVVVAPEAPADAVALLSRMTSSATEPTLSADDLDLLLDLARVVDVNGLSATDAGWTPTYDYNFAAAEGWRWKAAKAASSYAFTMDGDSPERSFLMIRCEHMADRYAAKIATSIPVSTGQHLPSYIPLI